MLVIFLILASLAAFWEVWTFTTFLSGRPFWITDGPALWWIGFIANTCIMFWMLVDCFAKPLKTNIRNKWIAAIIFLGVIGSAAYFFLVKMKKRQEGFEPAS